MHITSTELATLWGLPPGQASDLLESVAARWLPPPAKAFVDLNQARMLHLGDGQKSDGSWSPIGMTYDQLRYVLWVTAPMGRGKSEWLKVLFTGLFNAGSGLLALDCKGTDLVNGTIPLIPDDREQDVAILDLNGVRLNGDHLFASMNLLSGDFGRSLNIDYDTQASTVLSFFASLDDRFDSAPGMQNFATMGMLALIEGEPNATLQHLVRFYADEDYRGEVCERITNAPVKDFWLSRFPEMGSQDTGSLTSFQRRIDLLLTYPAIASLTVAPGCSINLREMMDRRGILLAGISAKDGKIASIAATLLLTQMTLGALSRTNVPESQRPDWPVVIDEAQIVFEKNPGMAPVIFSQLRAMRIGTCVVHQNIEQLKNIVGVLGGNAQNRLILGAEMEDATTYGNNYRALGVQKEDFLNMERFEHQYLKLYGTDAQLFSARMPPMVRAPAQTVHPRSFHNWRTVQARATSPSDQRLDRAMAEFKELAVYRPNDAVHRLGEIAMRDPQAYGAYCQRTRAHRAAQRAAILANPGSIPDKEQRIRTLSALHIGVPRIETQALQWALLMQARQAQEARKAQDESDKAAKKAGGSSKKKAPASVAPMDDLRSAEQPFTITATDGGARIQVQQPTTASAPESGAAGPGARARTGDTQPLPSLDDLLKERGARRSADDVATGFELFGE